MAVSKAQQKAVARYKKENYAEVRVLLSPKEKKEKIKALADVQGKSLNAFVNEALDEKMERDKGDEVNA